jgi:hypothetical protein
MKKRVLYYVVAAIFIILFIFILILVLLKPIKKDLSPVIKNSIVLVNYEYSGKEQNGTLFNKQVFGSGIIFFNKENVLQILTNRHVIDCGYLAKEPCYQRISESYNIMTFDNKYHNISNIIYPVFDLDIAILEINITDTNYNPVKLRFDDFKLGEEVVTIGYPSFFSGVLEYKQSPGKITGYRSLMTSDGFSFLGIDSDAYTNHGSSGGGLFDSKGNLIGINTWIEKEKSIAIKINFINDLKNFTTCPPNTFYTKNNLCLIYCNKDEVLGLDNLCYKKCTQFYCDTEISYKKDPSCPDNKIKSSDGLCHYPCNNNFCDENSYCFKNTCIACSSPLQNLYLDGSCRY